MQTIPRTTFNPPVFNPSGKERDTTLVSLAPQLTYYVEVRTSSLLTYLQKVYNYNYRDAISDWVTARQKTGFHFEINQHLHIAFADQRDGKGSQYWWIIYYDDIEKPRILENIKIQDNWVKTKVKNKEVKEELLWNGLMFRSQTEIRIAKVLLARNIIFFANANGYMDVKGLPITNHDNRMNEKAEVDFLVFYNQKCMILEVDGVTHNEISKKNWDSRRDRVFLRQGISTVRFTANECYNNTSAVIDEFLELFNKL